MKEFEDLNEEQQTLFCKLKVAISKGKKVASILEQYEPENKDSKDEDIKAVLTAFSPSGLSLIAFAVLKKNLKAVKDILDAVSNIEGLEKKILTEVQYKKFGGKGDTLLDYAVLYVGSNNRNQNEENAAKEIVKIIDERIKARGFSTPQEQQDLAAGESASSTSPQPLVENEQDQDVGTGALSSTPQPSIENKQDLAADVSALSSTPQPSAEDELNQDVGAGTSNTNKESNIFTKCSLKLTKEQEALHSEFFSVIGGAIGENQSVKDILKATKEYTNTDIEAVLTKFHGVGICSTLLAYTIEKGNTQALQDLLDIAKSAGLEKKILTNIQYKVKGGVQNTLLEHARDYKSNMVEIIEERMEANEIPIPPKPQDRAAGPDSVINSPESPSFLSQHGRKFAIIGTIALAGTIAAFMSGYPFIGVIVILSATSILATEKGRGMCDKLYDVLIPECFKSQKTAAVN